MLFTVALLLFAVGAFWLLRTDKIVDAMRRSGRFKAKNRRERQVLGARLYGWGSIVLGFGLIVLAALGV